MIIWVVGFDCRVMGVICDDAHQWLLGSCVKCSQNRGFGGKSFSSKSRNSCYKREDWSIVHFSMRPNWIMLLSADCCLSLKENVC